MNRGGGAAPFDPRHPWAGRCFPDTVCAALRRLLTEQIGCLALHVLEPAVMPFEGTTTTGAITCFHVGHKPPALRMRNVTSTDTLNGLTAGQDVPWSRVTQVSRWSILLRPAAPPAPASYIELGELVRVSRGQVTGNNHVWIATTTLAKALPANLLAPTITKARELLTAGFMRTPRPSRQPPVWTVDSRGTRSHAGRGICGHTGIRRADHSATSCD